MKIDVDELAKTLGLPTWDEWSEHFDYSDTYTYSYNEAYKEVYESQIDTGVSEAEAEAEATAAAENAGQEAEQAQQDEEFKEYYDNLMHVAEKVFEEHGLTLVPSGPPTPSSPGYKMADDLDGLPQKRKKRR